LPKDHDHSAYRFHYDLFLSGIERIILVSSRPDDIVAAKNLANRFTDFPQSFHDILSHLASGTGKIHCSCIRCRV
jgi:hypothetical protein